MATNKSTTRLIFLVAFFLQTNCQTSPFNQNWPKTFFAFIKKNSHGIALTTATTLIFGFFYLQHKKTQQDISKQAEEINKLNKIINSQKKNRVTPGNLDNIANLTIDTTSNTYSEIIKKIDETNKKIAEWFTEKIESVEKNILNKWEEFTKKQKSIIDNQNKSIDLITKQVKHQEERLQDLEHKHENIDQKRIKTKIKVIKKQEEQINETKLILTQNHQKLNEQLKKHNENTTNTLDSIINIIQPLKKEMEKIKTDLTLEITQKNSQQNKEALLSPEIIEQYPFFFENKHIQRKSIILNPEINQQNLLFIPPTITEVKLSHLNQINLIQPIQPKKNTTQRKKNKTTNRYSYTNHYNNPQLIISAIANLAINNWLR